MANCNNDKKKQLRNNKCVVCGKEFRSTGNCKYCSPECKTQQKSRNLHTIICKNCGKEVQAYMNAKFCSDECRIYYKNRQAALRKQNIRNDKLQGIENIDYVTCQICGMKAHQLGDAHFRVFHNSSLSKYKQLYPTAKITSQKFIQDNLNGSNNPNSVENTTEEERKERSPFSKEFYKKRHISLSKRSNLYKMINEKRIPNTCIEFYINKGFDEKESVKRLHERQQTFTLEKCILKYGEEEGKRRFEERQKNWAAKMQEKYKNGEYSTLSYAITSIGYSEFEIECINKIVEILNLSEMDYNAANSKNKQFEIFVKNLHKRFRYDFKYNNKIIEFHGDYWHCNPEKYAADYFNTQIKMTAKEKWQLDKIKNSIAISEGYDVLTVWESEYKNNCNAIIEKCIKFLTS